jgi:hypothetical protein
MISIITPTIRKEGLDVIEKALASQSYRDFEWIIGSPFDPHTTGAGEEVEWVKDDFEGGFWSLNRTYNALFRRCKGELIVSWQDWIWVPPDGLEKFVIAHEHFPNAVISGVGDQYMRVNKYGTPEINIWSDPRKGKNAEKYGSFYECMWNDIEWNWASFPKKLIYEIGGMDEELDFLGFGGDQYQVGERWEALGIKTYIDQTNESFTIRHNRDASGGQKKWDDNHVLFNGAYKKRKEELIFQGKWPKLDFLQNNH